MSHFVTVGIFWIDIYRTDLGCWRLVLRLIASLATAHKNHLNCLAVTIGL